jgi:hypothetical protein
VSCSRRWHTRSERLLVSELIGRGWIKGSKEVDESEHQVFEFLGATSIDQGLNSRSAIGARRIRTMLSRRSVPG